MPVFNDSNNQPPLLAEGDYIFCVTTFESKISQGAKTRGSDQYDLELSIEPTGKRVFELLTDHPSCSWKIDCFLKSAGVVLKKGEAFEFKQDLANASAVKWINPLGLRGWCKIVQETLPPREGKKPLTINRVAVFYTDKEQLPRVEVAEPDDDSGKPF